MRAVLDVNILISAVLSPRGTPGQILRRWIAGKFEVVVSEQLLVEFERALAYPKLASRISRPDAHRLVELLRVSGAMEIDTDTPPRVASDPGDDYLVALAQQSRSVLVTGDQHLLEIRAGRPIVTAREFLERLEPAQG